MAHTLFFYSSQAIAFLNHRLSFMTNMLTFLAVYGLGEHFYGSQTIIFYSLTDYGTIFIDHDNFRDTQISIFMAEGRPSLRDIGGYF